MAHISFFHADVITDDGPARVLKAVVTDGDGIESKAVRAIADFCKRGDKAVLVLAEGISFDTDGL